MSYVAPVWRCGFVHVCGGLALLAAGMALVVLGGSGPARGGSDMQLTGPGVGAAGLRQPISMSDLTSSFTLDGLPNTTQTRIGVVTMRVWTPNHTGYRVTVQADASILAPVAPGNPDAIAVARLQVRETGTTTFTPLSSTSAVTAHSQATMTGPPPGDAISNDYRVQIPLVRPGMYRVTLTYTAMTN
ncbi:hypothetical protein [Nonomuraea sp. B19D2]|uniref:hypothetical protein n=1 Tax=Nonomuraea sp. B19D2 TaxID=3159561 RepID=UPI0032DA3D00